MRRPDRPLRRPRRRRRAVVRRSSRAGRSRCSGRTARARPRPSRPSRATAARPAGTVRVLGLDPIADHARADPPDRRHAADTAASTPRIRPREALRLFASYYDDPADPDELLDRVGLRRSARTTVATACRAASSSGCRWPWRSSVGPRWPSSTSRPRASTRAGRQLIRRVIAELRDAGRDACCSPPTTSTRPSGWPTGSSSSTTAGCWPTARRPSSCRPARPTSCASARRPASTWPRCGGRSGRRSPRSSPGEYRVAGAPDPGHRRRHHRVAGRARPAPRRSARRPPAARGRLPAPDRVGRRRRATATDAEPASRPAAPVQAAAASAADEGLRAPRPAPSSALSLRQGEQLLVSIAIPLLLLVFFSLVDVLPKPDGVDHSRSTSSTPGILALAVMSTRDGQPRHRHRVRAPVRRAQAPRQSRRSVGPAWSRAKITMVLLVELDPGGACSCRRRRRSAGEPDGTDRPGRRRPISWAPPPSPASACCWPAP